MEQYHPRVGLSSMGKPLWNHPHRYTQGCAVLLSVSLNSGPRTRKVNHHARIGNYEGERGNQELTEGKDGKRRSDEKT